MSAGQTMATCVTSAIPRLVALFRLCIAYFEEFDEINDWLTNENAIYLQNYQLYLDVEYNVNELKLMTHISTAQQVELQTFWGVDFIYPDSLLELSVQKAIN